MPVIGKAGAASMSDEKEHVVGAIGEGMRSLGGQRGMSQ
jgi:hypothetical protein